MVRTTTCFAVVVSECEVEPGSGNYFAIGNPELESEEYGIA